MESRGILDCENQEHLYALHYVYTARINNRLQIFRSAWNTHPIRTAGNLNPVQLWVTGMLHNFHSSHLPVREMFCQSQDTSEDTENEDTKSADEDPEECYVDQALCLLIDRLHHSDVWGINVYVDTLDVIYSLAGYN